MTKEEVIQKIKEIAAKDTSLKDVAIKVNFNTKQKGKKCNKKQDTKQQLQSS